MVVSCCTIEEDLIRGREQLEVRVPESGGREVLDEEVQQSLHRLEAFLKKEKKKPCMFGSMDD